MVKCRGIFIFSQIVARHDHFLIHNSSVRKQQHKASAVYRHEKLIQKFKWTCSQTETMYKSNTKWRKLYILSCLITRKQNGGVGGGGLAPEGRLFEDLR